MLTLLVLIGMTINRTRQESQSDKVPVATKSNVSFVETLVTGPNDRQAKTLFQAVTDKEPLAGEEMPSYWRLMRWSMTERFDELWGRARKDRYLTHFAQAPQKHRGELVALKLSLRRAVSFDADKNSAGVKTVYEAWGVSEESRGNFYCVVFYDKPPELPIKPNIHEEAEFVGYFLKLLPYQDAKDKKHLAPLLIGRVRWRENPTRIGLQSQSIWSYWLLGSVAAIAVVVIWTNRYLQWGRDLTVPAQDVDHPSVESWLEGGMVGDSSAADEPTSQLDVAGTEAANPDAPTSEETSA